MKAPLASIPRARATPGPAPARWASRSSPRPPRESNCSRSPATPSLNSSPSSAPGSRGRACAAADSPHPARYTISMSTTKRTEYPLRQHATDLLNSLTPEPPPIRLDAEGVLRVGPTRVPIDTVIFAFNQGSTAEEILLRYPTLDLTHIYGVIAYYLWHREVIDAYLEERRKLAEQIQREVEARWPKDGVKERLLARL